jgi:hypothetical protein
VSVAAIAQAPSVSYSLPFEEPEGLESKVFQCSNGNTMFFTFTKKEGINLTIYDSNRRVKVKKEFHGTEWEDGAMVGGEVKGIYEMSGKVVLFLQQIIKKTPMLFRIVIDPVTGVKVEDKKIGELDKYGFGAGYAMAFGGTDPKTFHIVKDILSDCYAICRFDGFASESEHRIEITHYSGDHRELNKAVYELPAEHSFKYIRYLGMTVHGEKSVFISTYSFNTTSSGGDHSLVLFSRMNAGSKDFIHRPLEITEDFKKTEAVLQYNSGMKTLDMLLVTFVESKSKLMSNKTTNYYMLIHTSLDAETMTVLFTRPVVGEKVSQYAKSVFEMKDGYSGMPQDMVINPDYTSTMTFEEIGTTTTYSSRGGSSTSWHLGDIAVLELDGSGKETEGYVVRKRQSTGSEVAPMDQHKRSHSFMAFEPKRGFGGWANSGFYSYDFVSTSTARYVIYNDNPDNFFKSETEKIAGIGGISGTNTICQKLANGKAEKFQLFGNPKDEDKHQFSFINSSHYLREKQTYAVMMINQVGREKKAKIAWVSFP